MRSSDQRTVVVLALALSLGFGARSGVAQEGDSSVRLPWREFHELLQLDKDEIVLTWAEYQKILEQAGAAIPPEVAHKNGKVVLTREQLAAALGAMKPPAVGEPAPPAPPAEYLMTAARYRGKLHDGSVSVSAELELEVFERASPRYVRIPLLQQSIALQEILLDDEDAVVIVEGGRYTMLTQAAGRHRVHLRFAVSTPAEHNRQSFSFAVPRTPVTKLELELPLPDIEVEVNGAQQRNLEKGKGATLLTCDLVPTESIAVAWRRRLPEVEKGPAKVYADTQHHLLIEDDAIRVNAELSLTVLQNTIGALVVMVPHGMSVLNVAGPNVGDWRVLERDGGSFLEIPFDYPQKGSLRLAVVAEQLLGQEATAAAYGGFEVVDAIRDKGFVGIELTGASEVTLAKREGLDELDVSQLPPSLINRSHKPLLFGFKYLHHPFSLVLDITKHEELPVITTVIDSANGVTLFTEDGKLIHRVLYKVRNTSKQFLELELAEGTQIWSVFVADEPVKPRLDGDSILIPLNRSSQGASGLVAFDVEIIYFEEGKAFGWWGSRASRFPVPDVIISQLLWSLYLPVGYDYVDFGGSVEPEDSARGLRALLAENQELIYQPMTSAPQQAPAQELELQQEQAKTLTKRFSKNLALDQQQMLQQLANERDFSSRVQQVQGGQVAVSPGMVPMRIKIPTSGRVFRFAKNIVSEEELDVRYRFVADASTRVAKSLLVVTCALLLWLLRKRISVLVATLRSRVSLDTAPQLLAILAAVCLLVSKALTVVVALTAAGCFGYRWFQRRQAVGRENEAVGE